MNRVIPSTNFRICLQLCMLVSSMWVGPIPIGHSHANAMTSGSGRDALAQHLLHHHSADSCDNVGCNWHVHWIFRESGYSGINGEASAVQAMAYELAPSPEVRDLKLGDPPVALLDFTPSSLPDRTLAGANCLCGRSLRPPSLLTLSTVMRC